MYLHDRVDDLFGFGSFSRSLATSWDRYDGLLGSFRIDEGFMRESAVRWNAPGWLDGINDGLTDDGLANSLTGVRIGQVGPDPVKEERVADPIGEKGSDNDEEATGDPSPNADTVPGGVGSTAAVAVGGSVDVTIETLGDRDWYQVNLVAGQTYTIQTSSDGTGTDAYLRLRDAAGVLITENDDDGESTNSLITFTATTTGVHFIDAGTYNDDSTGSFHLFVAVSDGEVEANNSIATANALAIGGTVNAQINVVGDRDFYSVNLVAGQTYIFRTAPTSTPTNTTDTTLTLRDAAGNQILTNDDAGEFGFSAIRFTATSTGTFYLDVGEFGNNATGAYNISAFTAPTPTVFTTDQIANQLTNGYWGGAQHRFNVTAGGSLTFNVQGLTADGANLARAALGLWSDFTGITFNEVGAGGQIVFDDNQTGAFANSTYSNGIISASTVNVGTAWITTYGTGFNTYSFQTYIHEIGHALGLGHGGNYNGSADYATDSLYLNDSWATTIMSYFDQSENTYFQGQGFTRQFVITPGYADAVAIANLYGNSTTTRTGDTTYGFNNNSGRVYYDAATYPSVTYTITDDGGIDTLDYSGFTQNQLINLNPETFMNIGARVGNVSIARGTFIENAIGGSGNDQLFGNNLDNVLTGNAGADQLYGNDGNDTLIAEVGDTLIDGGVGTDTVRFGASGTITATLGSLEAINLTGGAAVQLNAAQLAAGFGSTGTFSGTGSLTIFMAAANPVLSMTGFTVAGGSSVAVTINGSTGLDQIKGIIGAANTINGGDGVDQIRGGNLADTINGGLGNDKLYGAGGADILTGGAGGDQFRYVFPSDSGLGAAADRITDFTIVEDRLNFQLMDADAATPGDQAFSFIATAAFTNTGIGQIRYQNSGADLLVQIDSDGNGVADMEVILQGLTGQTLTGSNFLL